MPASNLTLAAVDELNIDQLADLTPDAYDALLKEIVDAALTLQARSDKIVAACEARYGGSLTVERDTKNKEFGKATIGDGDWDVTQELRKRVKWDQAGLAKLRDTIRAAGDDPSVYIQEKVELTVSETAFAKWSPEIQAAFLPHRTTLVSGQPQWTFVRRGEKK